VIRLPWYFLGVAAGSEGDSSGFNVTRKPSFFVLFVLVKGRQIGFGKAMGLSNDG
jgi:hypothetical protein